MQDSIDEGTKWRGTGSRQAVAPTVNTALVWLYWNIGRRIREDILNQQWIELLRRSAPAVTVSETDGPCPIGLGV